MSPCFARRSLSLLLVLAATMVSAALYAQSETTDAIDSLTAEQTAQMPDEQVESSAQNTINTPPQGTTLPHDLSPKGMFLQADWVVKSVMILLALASLLTWTIFVAKSRELRALMVLQKNQLTGILNAASLQEVKTSADARVTESELLAAAEHELKLSENALQDHAAVKERVLSRLERIEAASARHASIGISVLASIGSTAPFVGLFGTVWGIMNSFIGISKAQTTNLAIVAPGIAEALLATALGLVAAIPAVVIYNHFARKIASYKALLGDHSAAVQRLISRELSRGYAG